MINLDNEIKKIFNLERAFDTKLFLINRVHISISPKQDQTGLSSALSVICIRFV